MGRRCRTGKSGPLSICEPNPMPDDHISAAQPLAAARPQAPLAGRVLIVDDVMSAGTAVRESIATIRAAGATPHAVAIALDRQEKATEDGVDLDHSAVQYVRNQLGLQVCAIATLADLLQYLAHCGDPRVAAFHQPVLAYRKRYGVG
jgi:orotate phosphoribosyltransferase